MDLDEKIGRNLPRKQIHLHLKFTFRLPLVCPLLVPLLLRRSLCGVMQIFREVKARYRMPLLALPITLVRFRPLRSRSRLPPRSSLLYLETLENAPSRRLRKSLVLCLLVLPSFPLVPILHLALASLTLRTRWDWTYRRTLTYRRILRNRNYWSRRPLKELPTARPLVLILPRRRKICK